jgi:hypothetical protein
VWDLSESPRENKEKKKWKLKNVEEKLSANRVHEATRPTPMLPFFASGKCLGKMQLQIAVSRAASTKSGTVSSNL